MYDSRFLHNVCGVGGDWSSVVGVGMEDSEKASRNKGDTKTSIYNSIMQLFF